jgi:hypothetical protein
MTPEEILEGKINDKIIADILDREKRLGYSNYGFTQGADPKSFEGLSEADKRKRAEKLFKERYLPTLKELPVPLRASAGDFFFNSEDPRGAIMEAAGIIDHTKKLTYYTKDAKGVLHFDPKKVEADWKANKDKVLSTYNTDPNKFLDSFDNARTTSYTGSSKDQAKLDEWKSRVTESRKTANNYLPQAKGTSTVNTANATSSSSNGTVPSNWKITAWKGDKAITKDPTTGKSSSTWNATQFAADEAKINEWAAKAGFDPNKWQGKDVNEKFQHFLHDNPDHPEWTKVVDERHAPTGTGTKGYGTPQVTGKMFDGKLGVRWLDAISEITKEVPKETPVVPETPVIEEKKLPGYVPPYEGQRRDAPYWLQDVINMGAATANRLSLKKYMPWAPKVEPHVPRPVLYDPTRALAANAEEMKIGTEGAGMFSGPQAFNSRFSQIQGQGAKNAANILSQYHTMNVNEINKFEQIKSGIYNQADAFNANQAQKLYDQTTIANQQFDNSKRKAFDEMRGAAVNAITNRAQAQTMNYMYPHYQIDPSRGGFTYGYRGADMVPGSPTDENSIFKKIEDAKTNYGVDEETARNVLGYGSSTKRGTGRSAEGDDFLNQYSQIQHKDGGASEEVKWLRKYNKFPSVLGS